MLKQIWFKKSETIDLVVITTVLASMFSLTTFRFDSQGTSIILLFIQYFLFLNFLLFSRLFVMKLFAYKNCFELILHQTHFSKYGPRAYDSLDEFTKDNLKLKISGIPSSILSIILYVLTLGILIFPSLWRYTSKKIPHKFIGTKQKYEYGMGFMIRRDVTQYREMKVLCIGYFYYAFFGLLMKFILPADGFLTWYSFMVFWIAFFTLLPIIGTEGWDLFVRSRLAYICVVTVLLLSMMCLIVFESIITILATTTIISLIVLFSIFYKYFL